MKPLLILIGAIVACAVGYMFEPKLRPHFTSAVPADEPAPVADEPAGETAPPAAETVVATPVPEPAKAKLPESITLTRELQFTDAESGLVITLAPGSKVKLLSIEGDHAVVRPGQTTYSVEVPLVATDLPSAQPTPEQPQPEPAVEIEPEPEPAKPTPVPELEPEPEPVPEPATEAAAEPFTEPAPEPAVTPAPAQALDSVGVMQQSIRSGQIKEFTADQVQDWQAGPQETVDGQAYQTGTVTYRAETIFGVKTIQAKALIQNGRVVRWIWPKSGMEIR
jgi:hypothetical protein